MAVRGPGRRSDASNTPFNRMRHNAARENNKGTREQKQKPAEQENYQESSGSASPGTRAGKSVQTGKQQPRQKAGSAQAGRGGEGTGGRKNGAGGWGGRKNGTGGWGSQGHRGPGRLGTGGRRGRMQREAETSATDSSSAGHARTRTQQGAAQSARTDSMGAARPPAGRAGRPPPPAHQLPEHGAPPGSAIERHRGVSKTIGMQSARRDGGNQQGRRGLSQRARGQRQGQGAAAPEGRRCPRRRRAAGGHPA